MGLLPRFFRRLGQLLGLVLLSTDISVCGS
jgi:hypothetical protein